MFCLFNTLFFGLPLTLWALPTNEVVLHGSKWCLLDYMWQCNKFLCISPTKTSMYCWCILLMWLPHGSHVICLSISVLFRCSMRAPSLFLSLFNYCISDFLSSASHYDFEFLISTYFIGFLVCLQSSYMSASLVAFFFCTCSNQLTWVVNRNLIWYSSFLLIMTFCIRLWRTLNLTGYHLFMSEDQRKEKNNSIFLIIRDE